MAVFNSIKEKQTAKLPSIISISAVQWGFIFTFLTTWRKKQKEKHTISHNKSRFGALFIFSITKQCSKHLKISITSEMTDYHTPIFNVAVGHACYIFNNLLRINEKRNMFWAAEADRLITSEKYEGIIFFVMLLHTF